MAGSRSRSLTSLIPVDALPPASTRSGSQRKSGAGAAPTAWRPLFICRLTSPVRRTMPTSLPDVAISHRQTQSQLLRRCECAYTQVHQDSANMECWGTSTADAIALSLKNDSAVSRMWCDSERVAMLAAPGRRC
jgi:hypothetical protein